VVAARATTSRKGARSRTAMMATPAAAVRGSTTSWWPVVKVWVVARAASRVTGSRVAMRWVRGLSRTHFRHGQSSKFA